MPQQNRFPSSLACGERLDPRAHSPKLFPEAIPGAWDFNRENIVSFHPKSVTL